MSLSTVCEVSLSADVDVKTMCADKSQKLFLVVGYSSVVAITSHMYNAVLWAVD